jgi:site-specific DNA-cytosine methylase
MMGVLDLPQETAIVLRNREGKPGGGKGPLLSAERQRTLGTANDQVVFTKQQFGKFEEGPSVASTLGARDHAAQHTDVALGSVGIPRRLTPVECERLMGWPDQHTAHGISEAGKAYQLADTARYKLCGNGIASPVTAWIGFQLRHYLTSGKPSPIL